MTNNTYHGGLKTSDVEVGDKLAVVTYQYRDVSSVIDYTVAKILKTRLVLTHKDRPDIRLIVQDDRVTRHVEGATREWATSSMTVYTLDDERLPKLRAQAREYVTLSRAKRSAAEFAREPSIQAASHAIAQLQAWIAAQRDLGGHVSEDVAN